MTWYPVGAGVNIESVSSGPRLPAGRAVLPGDAEERSSAVPLPHAMKHLTINYFGIQVSSPC